MFFFPAKKNQKARHFKILKGGDSVSIIFLHISKFYMWHLEVKEGTIQLHELLLNR